MKMDIGKKIKEFRKARRWGESGLQSPFDLAYLQKR
jgi:hypothetical protein